MIGDEIKILLRKADELRSLFVLGQNVIPFLEEIFVFVSEIQPLLDEINNSIRDNLRRMPNASKQLSKVTEATELATNEIMDLVDGIVFNAQAIANNLSKMQKIGNLESEKPIKVLEIIYNAIESGADVKGILPELANVIAQLKNNLTNDKESLVNNTHEILKSIQADSSSIMMSLQVQDITSQQIAAVNKLLETVQGKLESILKHFRDSDLNQMALNEIEHDTNVIRVSKLHREIAFDPNAVDAITNKAFRQTEVDEYIKMAQEDNLTNEEPTSQDDIDKLFNVDEIDDNESASTQDDIDKLFENNQSDDDNSDQPTSQDDIDKLFASMNNDDKQVENNNSQDIIESLDDLEEFSQDDIDKLFNN